MFGLFLVGTLLHVALGTISNVDMLRRSQEDGIEAWPTVQQRNFHLHILIEKLFSVTEIRTRGGSVVD